MILNCLLLYAISINAKSGLQKIIKSDQSQLGAVLKWGSLTRFSLNIKVVNLDSSFLNISSFSKKGKGLWPTTRDITIVSPNRSFAKRSRRSVKADFSPKILKFGPFPSSDYNAQSEKKKRRGREGGEKRIRPPAAPHARGGRGSPPVVEWAVRRRHVANAKANLP